MPEKRKHARIPFVADTEILLENESPYSGEIQNISLAGAFVKTDKVLKYEEKLTLRFSLPGVTSICEIPCIVRWTKKDEGAGLQFETLRAIEVWALNKIARNAP